MAVAAEEQIQIVTATLSTRSEFEFQILGLSAKQPAIADPCPARADIAGRSIVVSIPNRCIIEANSIQRAVSARPIKHDPINGDSAGSGIGYRP